MTILLYCSCLTIKLCLFRLQALSYTTVFIDNSYLGVGMGGGGGGFTGARPPFVYSR